MKQTITIKQLRESAIYIRNNIRQIRGMERKMESLDKNLKLKKRKILNLLKNG